MKLFLDKFESILEKFYISEKNYKILESKVDHLEKKYSEVKEDLNSLRKSLHSIEVKSSHSEDFWGGTFDFIVKIIWIIVVSFILYKLGINPPPV